MSRTRKRTFRRTPGRTLDWTGIIQDTIVLGAGVPTHTNLWTPVMEMEHATVTRIRGQIVPAMGADIQASSLGTHQFEVFGGIQVVNRAAGGLGIPRDPGLNDDQEGGEWLWKRSWTFHWTTVRENTHGDGYFMIVNGGDVLTGAFDPYVDVKAQRKLDLSQDELLVSFSALGTDNTDGAQMHVDLRMLLKF